MGEEFTVKGGKAPSALDVEGKPLRREVESTAVGEWGISVRGEGNGRGMRFKE